MGCGSSVRTVNQENNDSNIQSRKNSKSQQVASSLPNKRKTSILKILPTAHHNKNNNDQLKNSTTNINSVNQTSNLAATHHILAVYSQENSSIVKIMKMNSGKILYKLTIPFFITAIAQLNADSIVTGLDNNTIAIWNIQNQEKIQNIHTPFTLVLCLLNLGEDEFITGGSDCLIKIWRKIVEEDNSEDSYSDNDKSGIDEDKSFDNKYNSTIKSRNLRSLRSIARNKNKSKFVNVKTIVGHKKAISCLVNLREDEIASGSYDKTIKIWSITEGVCLLTLNNQTNSVSGLIVSNKIKFTKEVIRKLIHKRKDKGEIIEDELDLNEDSHWLISSDFSGKISVWDVEINHTSGCLYKEINAHNDQIHCLIKLNEKEFISLSDDGYFNIWEEVVDNNYQDLKKKQDNLNTTINEEAIQLETNFIIQKRLKEVDYCFNINSALVGINDEEFIVGSALEGIKTINKKSSEVINCFKNKKGESLISLDLFKIY